MGVQLGGRGLTPLALAVERDGGLHRERDGACSRERGGELREDATVGVERNLVESAHPELCQTGFVLEPDAAAHLSFTFLFRDQRVEKSGCA